MRSVCASAEAGDEDHRQERGRRACAQPPAKLIAIDARHQDVGEHEVRRLRLYQAKRLGAVVRDVDFVAEDPQQPGDHFRVRALVVDDQDALGHLLENNDAARVLAGLQIREGCGASSIE